MFTVSRGIPINDVTTADQPLLTRDHIWRGLVLKADNALPFVPKMTKCEVTHRAPTWLERDIVFRDEPASERVTFFPREEVRFERLSGATLGTIRNQIEESDGALILRFTFSLEREGIEPGSAEEQAYAKEMEGAYLGAVDATLSAIRKFTTAETSSSPVEVASSPEIVGYVQRLLEVLDRQDVDTFASFFAPDGSARIGNTERSVGQKRLLEAFKSYLKAAGGPRHEIVDVWHVDRLIGAETTMTSQREGKSVAVPCVYLLAMDGDLIKDLRVFADFGPFST